MKARKKKTTHGHVFRGGFYVIVCVPITCGHWDVKKYENVGDKRIVRSRGIGVFLLLPQTVDERRTDGSTDVERIFTIFFRLCFSLVGVALISIRNVNFSF